MFAKWRLYVVYSFRDNYRNFLKPRKGAGLVAVGTVVNELFSCENPCYLGKIQGKNIENLNKPFSNPLNLHFFLKRK